MGGGVSDGWVGGWVGVPTGVPRNGSGRQGRRGWTESDVSSEEAFQGSRSLE